MAYSSWKIWLHPSLTASVMEELEAELVRSKAEAEAAELVNAELAELREKVEQLTEDLARGNELALLREKELEEELHKRGEELKQVRETLASKEDELADRKDTEQQIKEFEDRLAQFQLVKDRYEERISRLRNEIKRLRGQMGLNGTEDDELSEIKMRDGGEEPRPDTKDKNVDTEEEDEDDWLESLPR